MTRYFFYWRFNQENVVSIQTLEALQLPVTLSMRGNEQDFYFQDPGHPEITPPSLATLWGLFKVFMAHKKKWNEKEREYGGRKMEWEWKSSVSLHIAVVFSISGFEGLRKGREIQSAGHKSSERWRGTAHTHTHTSSTSINSHLQLLRYICSYFSAASLHSFLLHPSTTFLTSPLSHSTVLYSWLTPCFPTVTLNSCASYNRLGRLR